MRAYSVNFFCEPLEPVELGDPVPQGTEVLIEVTRCGVCHTDIHIQDGYYDLGGGKRLNLEDRGVKPPIIMGHEVLGKLVAKGPDAPIADSEIGKTFLVYPWLGCGECDVCRRGDDNLCPKPQSIGVFRPGGYAEKCIVRHPRYLIDVSGLDETLAATYACSGVTAYGALNKVNIDKENDLLLVVGLGGVGMSALQIAKGIGFKNIAVADIDQAKRDRAIRQGIQLAIDPRNEEDVARLLDQSGGVSGVIDFVGSAPTVELALKVLRKGGTCVVVGLFGGSIDLPIPPLVQRVITLRGSYVGSPKELRELVALAKDGKIEGITVEAVEFKEVNTALERLRKGQVEGRLVLSRSV